MGNEKKANGAELAQVGFKYIGIPYSDLDCQAFVEVCLADCGIKINLPGSNAWYREVAKNGWVGTPEDCVAKFGTVPKGAFLFILKNDGGEPDKYKPDGIGNASHIGIVTGTGKGAIHSSASRGCVCESEFHNKTIKNGGWNRVGLWDEVDYFQQPTPEPEPEPEPTQTAVVYADNGKPVKMRAEPSFRCRLYWEIQCGETVLVLDPGTDWSKISWNGIDGYMLTRFLLFDGGTQLYTVTIPHLSKSQADALISQYPGSIMTEERG